MRTWKQVGLQPVRTQDFTVERCLHKRLPSLPPGWQLLGWLFMRHIASSKVFPLGAGREGRDVPHSRRSCHPDRRSRDVCRAVPPPSPKAAALSPQWSCGSSLAESMIDSAHFQDRMTGAPSPISIFLIFPLSSFHFNASSRALSSNPKKYDLFLSVVLSTSAMVAATSVIEALFLRIFKTAGVMVFQFSRRSLPIKSGRALMQSASIRVISPEVAVRANVTKISSRSFISCATSRARSIEMPGIKN